MYVVIAYDVVCDRRRTRVARMLLGYGERVNYSVFECDLTDRQFLRLQKELEKLVNPKEDRVRYYRLCLNCLRQIEVYGQTASIQEDQIHVV